MIRAAREADLPAILDITNDAIRNTTAIWSLTITTLAQRQAWLRERQAAGFPVLVHDDGGVLGFGSFGPFRDWEGYAHTVEHAIYVRSDAQGQGVGRALLQALIEAAEERRLHVMVAAIEAENGASLRLHEQLGFEPVGRLREVGRKFDRWLDLVFMQKMLGERIALAAAGPGGTRPA